MPPRFAYWTIILDGAPTSFRMKDRDEILPLFNQLKAKNPGALLKWFSGGRLWDSPEQAKEVRDVEKVRRFREERAKDTKEQREIEDREMAAFQREHSTQPMIMIAAPPEREAPGGPEGEDRRGAGAASASRASQPVRFDAGKVSALAASTEVRAATNCHPRGPQAVEGPEPRPRRFPRPFGGEQDRDRPFQRRPAARPSKQASGDRPFGDQPRGPKPFGSKPEGIDRTATAALGPAIWRSPWWDRPYGDDLPGRAFEAARRR